MSSGTEFSEDIVIRPSWFARTWQVAVGGVGFFLLILPLFARFDRTLELTALGAILLLLVLLGEVLGTTRITFSQAEGRMGWKKSLVPLLGKGHAFKDEIRSVKMTWRDEQGQYTTVARHYRVRLTLERKEIELLETRNSDVAQRVVRHVRAFHRSDSPDD